MDIDRVIDIFWIVMAVLLPFFCILFGLMLAAMFIF